MIVTVDSVDLDQPPPGGDAGRPIHASFSDQWRRHSGFQMLWSWRVDVISHNQA